MQCASKLMGIGTCIGLAVVGGTLFHQHTHIMTKAVPATAKTIVTRLPITAETYGRLPISFERNHGQVDKQVAFLSHGPGYNLFLTANQAVISLHTSGVAGCGGLVAGSSITKNYRGHFTNYRHRTTTHVSRTNNQQPITSNPDAVLRLRLLGANANPQISGMDQLPGIANYFIGNDPKKWHTHVPTYGRVSYKQVYPGIDMVYCGS